jgi:hypothetical protein
LTNDASSPSIKSSGAGLETRIALKSSIEVATAVLIEVVGLLLLAAKVSALGSFNVFTNYEATVEFLIAVV